MKSFFKYLLATILGVILSSFIVMLIVFGMISSAISRSEKTVEVKENSILVLDLNRIIEDRGSNNPLDGFDFMRMRPSPRLGLNEILKAIENAANDPKILGIYMENTIIPARAGTLEEIRNALVAFKDSGKFIISHSDFYTQRAYYLSSVADSIFLNPEGTIEWVGLRSEVMFYKNAFEKLGVEPQIIKHGKYKSFVEPFTSEKLSPENREQISSYLGSIWNHWIEGVSESRGISPTSLNTAADNLSATFPSYALEQGLVDGLRYKDQVIDLLKQLTDTKPEKDINAIGVAQYAKIPIPLKGKGIPRDKIAVIYASGDIIFGDGDEANIAGERYARTIREARRDSTIKAIVLRINSGGGSALASEVIWREMALAGEVKPVVVSMGDVAASGGYYIAAPAHAIVANPTTITGSIGVFGMFFNVQKGMNSKLGLNVDVVKTNRNSDFGSPFRALTAEERSIGQRMVEDVYDTFVGHVAKGRGMSTDDVNAIAQGRVWSGAEALEINLIDEIGGLQRAIELAAEKAELDRYRVTELPKLDDPFEAILKSFTGSARAKAIQRELGDAYKYYNSIMSLTRQQGVQARLPFDLEVY